MQPGQGFYITISKRIAVSYDQNGEKIHFHILHFFLLTE